jgi:hypothetical protein
MKARGQMAEQVSKMQQKENWYQQPSDRLVSHLAGARRSNLQQRYDKNSDIESSPDPMPLAAAKSSSGFRYPHMQQYAPKPMAVRESILGKKRTVNVPYVSQ